MTPTLSANCAPDASHYAWTINLHPENDQIIEMSWGSGAVFQSTNFGTSGAHTFATGRGGATLVVRYASDRNVKTSATANATLCGSGTTGGTVAGSQQNSSANSNGGNTPTCEGVAKILSHSDIQWSQGGVAKVSFTMGKGCTGQELSLVSYTAPSDTFSRESAAQQRIFQAKTGTFGDMAGAHTYVLSVNVPSCFFQIDFVTGKPIAQFGPAESNHFYSDQGRLLAGVNGGTMSCNATNAKGANEIAQIVTPNSAPASGNAVAGFQTPPNGTNKKEVGSVNPIVELPGGSDQQSPTAVQAGVQNGNVAGVQNGPVAGVQSLPSTGTDRTPVIPLAAMGLAIMALGGILLRRRDPQL